MTAPSKEIQEAESANRDLVRSEQEAGGTPQATPQEVADAREVFDDPVRGEAPEAPQPQEAAERAEERTAPIDPRAAKRAEISARFRSDRKAEAEGEDFSRSGTPEGFDYPVPDLAPEQPVVEAAQEQPVQQVEDQPAADPQPRMVKVKIRGKEYEVTEGEYHAAAQKSLAGDSYLDDAKARLTQADELYRDIENRAKRPSPSGEHHARQEETHQPQPAATEDPQHPEDDQLAKAIEQIQYGDPAEAKQLLDSAVEQRATKVAERVVQNTLQSREFADEGARTAKVLKDFEDQHQDLAKDPRARAAIEATVYELQKADLEALGVDPNKLPTRSGQVTPADIAQAHLWYRTKGYTQVRSPGDLLKAATDDFLAWKGQPTRTDDTPADPNPHEKAPPRIEVRVDRNERRQSIPQQPSRSAAPQRSITPPAPQPRDRSAIVAGIKAQRAKPRGQVLGA